MSGPNQPFAPAAGTNRVLALTGTSATAALASVSSQVRVYNSGANKAYFRTYSSAAGVPTVTTADYPVAPGGTAVVTVGASHDSIAHLSATGTTTLEVMSGEGWQADAGGSGAASVGPGGGQQVEGNAASGATDTGNPVKVGGVIATTPSVQGSDGQRVNSQYDPYGGAYVVLKAANSLATANISAPGSDAASVQNALAVRAYGTYFNGATWDRARGTTVGASVVLKPEVTGGCLKAKVNAAATTNATVVKASAGQVFGGQFLNASAATAYLKIFNKATAPVLGTDIPVDIIGIPAGGRVEISRPLGDAYTAGISYAITANPADLDATAVAASAVVGSFSYI